MVKKLTTVDLSIIQDYGCYCNFDDNGENDNFREKAKGRPLDDVDRFCKTLHDGYTCAQVDANNNQEEEENENPETSSPCKPWQTTYNSAFNNGLYHDLRIRDVPGMGMGHLIPFSAGKIFPIGQMGWEILSQMSAGITFPSVFLGWDILSQQIFSLGWDWDSHGIPRKVSLLGIPWESQ